jgi:DegV family protein with EDD domain
MAGVSIITDSSAYLPDEFVKKYGIIVIPLTLHWEGKSYLDGIDISANDFYVKLKNAHTLPTTSQVPINDFVVAIQKELDKGKSVIVLPISKGISATYQSALAAKEQLKNDNVEILDTCLVSMALSFQVLAVARAAEKGASLAECKKVAEMAYEHIGVYFVVDSLKYLYKGGRIGGAKRLLGAALSIKPILQIREGKIEAAGSAITRKKAIEEMVQMVKTAIGDKKPVRISVFHALEGDLAKELLTRLNKEMNTTEGILSEVSPAVGAHVGPGTISIAWMAGM